MADVYIVTLSILGIWITGPGLMLGLNVILPARTERVYWRLLRTPWLSLIAGLVITVLVAFAAVLAANAGGGGFSAVLVLFTLGLWALGAAAMTRIAAERIDRQTGSADRLRSMLRGAVLLELAGFVPLVGWFLFTPLVGVAQIGAGALGLFGREPKRVTQAAERLPADLPGSGQGETGAQSEPAGS